MAYYPLSQITPNLYTNGDEFIYLVDKKPYIGYYYSVLANTALKHFKKEKAYILDSGTLSEMELFCKFAPTRDLDFIIKNLDLECL